MTNAPASNSVFAVAPIGAVAVVVVTHSGPSAMLRDCLASVATAGGADIVLVVDNSERAGTDAVADTGTYGLGVSEVIRTPNRGYGAAANAGAQRAVELTVDPDSLAIALLNDDVVVADGWLSPLVAALDRDSRLGAVQPKLLMAATDPMLVNSVGVRFDRHGAGVDDGFGQEDGPRWTTGRAIPMFTGGAVVFRYDFLRTTGGFDGRYFLYYEDVDLALRGAELGWSYRCEPSSTVLHLGGATAGTPTGRVAYAQERNRLWVAFRFGSRGHIARALWLSVRRLRHEPRRLHASALTAAVRAVPRILSERRRHSMVDDLARESAGPPRTQLRGVNVLGYHQVTSGLGEAARQMVQCFEAAGIPCVAVDVPSTKSPARRPVAPVPDDLFDVTIAVVTAAELPGVLQTLPAVHTATRHLVGYWFWELSEMPPGHRAAVDLVDEIWAPTSFVRDAYALCGTPVRLVPMRIPEPIVSAAEVDTWRDRFGLSSGSTLFLVSLDLFSDAGRKNPFGAIEAFVRAFGNEPDLPVRLVVKTINGDQRPADLERIVSAAAADPRILVVDEHVGVDALHALIAAADCYVSLHRSEGLGLHLADAMWLGTPVLATRYSGNLDLMDDASAALVDAGLVAVGRAGDTSGDAYGTDFVWADPDLDAAAEWMRRIAHGGAAVGDLAAQARFRMELQPSARALGLAYRDQLLDPDAAPSVVHRRYLPDFNEMLHGLRTRSLRTMPAGASRLASVGCAGGWYFDWVEQNYGPVDEHVGVELYAPEPPDLPANVRWIAASAGDLHAIDTGSVDLMFSGQNIEHLWPSDVVGFLVEANRVLRPGGWLVIDSPNRLVTQMLNWSQPEHTVEFTPGEARELLHLAGFTTRRLDGLWNCDRDAGGAPSLFAGSASELRSRARTTADDADDSFVWWAEADRTGDADVEGLERRVEEIFAAAWPQRLERTIVPAGIDTVDDGRVRVLSGRSAVLFHGPYAPLTAGDYVAVFDVTVLDADAAETVTARCVVLGDGRELASVAVQGRSSGSVEVPFTLGDTTFGVQFRAEATGTGSVECRPAAELRPLRPHGV